MDITILQHAKDNSPGRISMDEVAALIRGENRPEGYRPLMVVAAVVEGGLQRKNIRWLTGLAVAHLRSEKWKANSEELDEARRTADEDLHTMLCFADEQGDGLYIVYPFELFDGYQLEKQIQYYPKVFAWGSDYYARLLGTQADRTCCGVTRAIPLTLDHEATYNPSAMWFSSDEIHAKPPDRQAGDSSNMPATPKEIRAFLDGRVYLRRNIIKGRPEYRNPGEPADRWRLLDNTKLNTLYSDLRDERRVSKDDIVSTINSEHYPAFHPFQDNLDRLPPWDEQTDHIIGLALSVMVKGSVEKQMLFVEYLRKWLVGMIAGWIDEREVNSAMLIFIGKQGKFKTTWFNYILPPELQQYYCTKVDSGRMEKDDRLKLSQYGLICCEELDAMSSTEMNKLKTVMTMRFTDDRAPFDRYPEQRKHIASYCGTGNNVIFLNDKTGTRRFLPFEIERIDDPRTHPIDYEGVYSQAYTLYRQGFRYYFTEAEEEVLKEHNQRFETPRPEEDLIDYYFRKPNEMEIGEVLPVTIAQQIVCTPSNRVGTDALARAFEKLGYECAGNGGYRLVRRTDEERKQRACSLAYEARYGIKSGKDGDDSV